MFGRCRAWKEFENTSPMRRNPPGCVAETKMHPCSSCNEESKKGIILLHEIWKPLRMGSERSSILFNTRHWEHNTDPKRLWQCLLRFLPSMSVFWITGGPGWMTLLVFSVYLILVSCCLTTSSYQKIRLEMLYKMSQFLLTKIQIVPLQLSVQWREAG